MKAKLRDYLYFTRSQRRGAAFLILFIALALIAKYYFLNHTSESQMEDLSYYTQLIEEEEAELSNEVKHDHSKLSVTLFDFDPNVIGLEEWKALGFSEKQAKSILKYREKGGKFFKASDLKNLYVVSDKKYKELEPYVLINEKALKTDQEDFKEYKEPIEERSILVMDLNTADSLDLVRLKGIGPVYANRIIKYRKLLGGFVSKEQLHEVWGLSDSTILSISPQLELTDKQLNQIDINLVEVKELAAHPYIDWNLAKAIVNYREQHGKYSDLEDLRNIYLLNDSVFQRIFPYLAVAK